MRINGTIAAAVTVVLIIAATGCSGSGSSSSSTPVTGSDRPTSTVAASVAESRPVSAPPATTLTSETTSPPPATTIAATTTLGGAVDPNAPEIVEPGDIPDNQVFIPYAATNGIFTVKVPEGWARTDTGGVVTFTDNYNSIDVQSVAATTAPTTESVRAEGLADVKLDPTFALVDVQPVTRKAGTGVLATYEIGSAPNAVTGKKALLAVERYFFFHNGTTVVLTLSGAKGADNVDPWRIVSDSLTWL